MQTATFLVHAANLMAQGRFGDAEPVIRRALNEQPNNIRLMKMLSVALYETGRIGAAVEIVESALRLQPNSPDLHSALGRLFQQLRDFKKAAQSLHQAAELAPTTELFNDLGVAYAQDGQQDKAIASFARAIKKSPTFIPARANLANAQRQMGLVTEAEKTYRDALSISPDDPDMLNDLATILRDRGDLTDAAALYNKAISLRPHFTKAIKNLALAKKDQGHFAEARGLLLGVLRDEPNDAVALANLGAVELDENRPAFAVRALMQSIHIDPTDGEAFDLLGQALQECQEPVKAEEALRKAISLKPGSASAWNNLAWTLVELGRLDEATAAVEQALAIKPDYVAACMTLGKVRPFKTADDAHFKEIERRLVKPEGLPINRRINLHFAAGRAYQDLGRYEEAFAQFLLGNGLERARMSYDVEKDAISFFQRIQDTFDQDLLTRFNSRGHPSKQPIFILGMPRSGTTLIEQILSSHPGVAAGGELSLLSQAVAMNFQVGDGKNFTDYMSSIEPEALARIGASYVEMLDSRAPGAAQITDKQTSNFIFLGLIHLCLPNAKVIHAVRNPVDTCLSCFTLLFAKGQVRQAYDLAELGRYYAAYDRLMNHWRNVLPPSAFLEVRYEEVVANTEIEARRMLDFCGLEWHPNVLEFHRSARPVRTASATQVRKPIYTSSISRWRRYEKFLGPLLRELGELANE